MKKNKELNKKEFNELLQKEAPIKIRFMHLTGKITLSWSQYKYIKSLLP